MKKENLSVQAYNHKILNKLIYDFSLVILSEKFNSIRKITIEEEVLKKGIWLASILCDSIEEHHRRKGQLFSSLLFLNFKDDVSILQACYILFSRLGNLTATKFLNGLYETQEKNPIDFRAKYEFGDFITNELIYERESRIIEAQDTSYLITDFQKELWNALNNQSEIAISAPTSSGKSFIIKQFLINEFSNGKPFKVLYIVPSRALINQVNEEFKIEISSDVHVKTSFVKENEIFEKEIYVLTPERCIKILNSNIEIDFVFIDEIQGVEDINGRGLTFEYVFNEI
ncbi:DEAD/DEAH box helicase [Flavobacterium sp. LB3P122]|uniref:DEAD/DEAH box helicase n=1 Tax=Flavobacterium algoriphilum TaxID=3398738 RepID=UPI003A84BA7D